MDESENRSVNATRAMARRTRLDLISTVAIVIAAAAVVWTSLRSQDAAAARQPPPARSEVPVPSVPLSLAGAALKGSSSARVGLLEFSDFQCPFCGKFSRETLPALTTKYVDTNQVLVAFRHLPLERIHPLAVRAGAVASCSAERGLFWKVHDAFFQEPVLKTEVDISTRAAAAGFSQEDQKQCATFEEAVRRDAGLAESLGVSSTPIFFWATLRAHSLPYVAFLKVRGRSRSSSRRSTNCSVQPQAADDQGLRVGLTGWPQGGLERASARVEAGASGRFHQSQSAVELGSRACRSNRS